MKKLKAAVLGPIPRDYITTHQNEVIQKYGCVTHTAIAMSNLMGELGTVFPVTHIRKSDANGIAELFRNYHNIDTSYISSEADMGDVIQLRFVDQHNRYRSCNH